MVDELAQSDEPLGTTRHQDIAVLFADIVGFTAMSEGLPPAGVIDILRDFHARMERTVFDEGGTLDKYIGDGVMALFGAPIAHEDSARRAVAAALEMQKSLDDYAVEVKQRYPIECRFRVGLNTGPVVVGKISDNPTMRFFIAGYCRPALIICIVSSFAHSIRV